MYDPIRTPLLAAIAVLAVIGPAGAACEPDGEVSFICGPVSPEDLVAIPDTPWILGSSMGEDGHLFLVHEKSHEVERAFPVSSSEPRLDRERFADCTGSETTGFQPHGLSLRPGSGGRHTLYVVRHGAREAIEVFKVDATGGRPAVTWVGCAPAPEGIGFNSVTYLPDGAFAATNFHLTAGQVWEWQPGHGWAEVPGSETPGPNGLVASPDGDWLYIGGWGTQSLIRLSRGRQPIESDAVEVGFHIDNVRWAPDGSLLAAGQLGSSPAAIGNCLRGGQCDGVTSHVARVDPETLEAEEIFSYASTPTFILGTVALVVGDELWVGQVGGGDRIARLPRP